MPCIGCAERIPEDKHALEAMAREHRQSRDVDMSEVSLISIIEDDSLAREGI